MLGKDGGYVPAQSPEECLPTFTLILLSALRPHSPENPREMLSGRTCPSLPSFTTWGSQGVVALAAKGCEAPGRAVTHRCPVPILTPLLGFSGVGSLCLREVSSRQQKGAVSGAIRKKYLEEDGESPSIPTTEGLVVQMPALTLLSAAGDPKGNC